MRIPAQRREGGREAAGEAGALLTGDEERRHGREVEGSADAALQHHFVSLHDAHDFCGLRKQGPSLEIRLVWHGVSKGVKDGCMPPTLWAGHPRNGHKAVSGLARPQGVQGLGMAGPGETLGSPWIPLTIWAC
jgi:hypothetical protein